MYKNWHHPIKTCTTLTSYTQHTLKWAIAADCDFLSINCDFGVLVAS